jgi:hypothetical protein
MNFYSESFDVDIRFTQADVHRFDAGHWLSDKMWRIAMRRPVVGFQARDEATNNYTLSSLVLFLKYKRYINWLIVQIIREASHIGDGLFCRS